MENRKKKHKVFDISKVSDQEFIKWFQDMGLNEAEVAFLYGVKKIEVIRRIRNLASVRPQRRRVRIVAFGR